MKNRSSLVLMEQLVMLLVFALCAALCLKIFAAAREQSDEARRVNEAVLIAQNTAETLKACRGDYEELAGLSGWEKRGQSLCFTEGGCLVEIRPMDSKIPGLGRAGIRVSCDGEDVFAIETAWQEARQ